MIQANRSLNGKRILVTGANGFMGSHLIRRLLRTKASSIYGLYLRETSLVEGLDLELREVDLTQPEAVTAAIKEIRPEIIFNLAAMVNVGRDLNLASSLFAVNTQGPINLVTACAAEGFESFVHIGTCEEYGDNPTPFTEDQVPNPVSPYSASKVAATYFFQMLHKTQKLPVTVLRPFLTYGPHLRNRMLTTMLIKAGLKGESLEMTSAEQTREFNYVDDVVEGFIQAAQTPAADGQIINIGCGDEVKIADMARLVMELFDGQLRVELGALPYRPGETWHFYCSNKKAQELLGYTPKVSLREGLTRTIDWYRAHPEVVEAL
ncbi:MAG: NAD-dependent epimerase/dehydratase family protein [Myxococcales bacterium]|nr:NAD-dependent epimerase/dehydratase family protein [Myxococcales bacterium]